MDTKPRRGNALYLGHHCSPLCTKHPVAVILILEITPDCHKLAEARAGFEALSSCP